MAVIRDDNRRSLAAPHAPACAEGRDAGSASARFAAQSGLFLLERFPRIAMLAYVYKSLKKADTYLYLAGRDDFDRLPEPLRTQLGALQFVLEVDLMPERKLAQEDPAVVLENLTTRGFHLQFPPTMPDPMSDDWGTDA